jgi:hypothetical protein
MERDCPTYMEPTQIVSMTFDQLRAAGLNAQNVPDGFAIEISASDLSNGT